MSKALESNTDFYLLNIFPLIDKFEEEFQYHFSEPEKEFIKTYFLTNSLSLVKEHLNIDLDTCASYYRNTYVRECIKYLNMFKHKLIYQRKMLNLEQMGSFLSSYILDYNVADNDKLDKKEKLEYMKLLLELHKVINNSLQEPAILNKYDTLDVQFKELSIQTIKSLLHNKQNSAAMSSYDNKDDLIINELSKKNNLNLNEHREQDIEKLNKLLKQ